MSSDSLERFPSVVSRYATVEARFTGHYFMGGKRVDRVVAAIEREFWLASAVSRYLRSDQTLDTERELF
jgi:hypothetical protein